MKTAIDQTSLDLYLEAQQQEYTNTMNNTKDANNNIKDAMNNTKEALKERPTVEKQDVKQDTRRGSDDGISKQSDSVTCDELLGD